jgi:hypothetical protein
MAFVKKETSGGSAPTDKWEVTVVALAGAEQTTAVLPLASTNPPCPLSPPLPRPRAETVALRCLKGKTSGKRQKKRRAGFGPAGQKARHCKGDTFYLSA